MVKDYNDARSVLFYKVYDETWDDEAKGYMDFVNMARTSQTEYWSHITEKHNKMTLKEFENFVRGAYEEEGYNSLDPKIDKMILDGIEEIRKMEEVNG